MSSDNAEQRGANLSQWSSQLEKMLLGKPGLGTRCMDASVHTIEYVVALLYADCSD